MGELKPNTDSWIRYITARSDRLRNAPADTKPMIEGALRETNDVVSGGENKVVYVLLNDDGFQFSTTQREGYTRVDLSDGLSFEELRALGIEPKQIDVVAGQGWKLVDDTPNMPDDQVISDEELVSFDAAVQKYADAYGISTDMARNLYIQSNLAEGDLSVVKQERETAERELNIDTFRASLPTDSPLSRNTLNTSHDVVVMAHASTFSRDIQETVFGLSSPIATPYEGGLSAQGISSWGPTARGFDSAPSGEVIHDDSSGSELGFHREGFEPGPQMPSDGRLRLGTTDAGGLMLGGGREAPGLGFGPRQQDSEFGFDSGLRLRPPTIGMPSIPDAPQERDEETPIQRAQAQVGTNPSNRRASVNAVLPLLEGDGATPASRSFARYFREYERYCNFINDPQTAPEWALGEEGQRKVAEMSSAMWEAFLALGTPNEEEKMRSFMEKNEGAKGFIVSSYIRISKEILTTQGESRIYGILQKLEKIKDFDPQVLALFESLDGPLSFASTLGADRLADKNAIKLAAKELVLAYGTDQYETKKSLLEAAVARGRAPVVIPPVVVEDGGTPRRDAEGTGGCSGEDVCRIGPEDLEEVAEAPAPAPVPTVVVAPIDRILAMPKNSDGLIVLHGDRAEGLEAIRILNENKPQNVVIIVTATGCSHCQEALSEGVYRDYASNNPNVSVFWYQMDTGRTLSPQTPEDLAVVSVFGLQSFPTVITYENGRIAKKQLEGGRLYRDQSTELREASSFAYEGEYGRALAKLRTIPEAQRTAATRERIAIFEKLVNAQRLESQGRIADALRLYTEVQQYVDEKHIPWLPKVSEKITSLSDRQAMAEKVDKYKRERPQISSRLRQIGGRENIALAREIDRARINEAGLVSYEALLQRADAAFRADEEAVRLRTARQERADRVIPRGEDILRTEDSRLSGLKVRITEKIADVRARVASGNGFDEALAELNAIIDEATGLLGLPNLPRLPLDSTAIARRIKRDLSMNIERQQARGALPTGRVKPQITVSRSEDGRVITFTCTLDAPGGSSDLRRLASFVRFETKYIVLNPGPETDRVIEQVEADVENYTLILSSPD